MSEPSVPDKLSNMMREVMRDHSLKGEALKEFGELAAKVEEQEHHIRYLEDDKRKMRAEKEQFAGKVMRLEEKIAEYVAKEDEIAEREGKVFELEKETAVHRAVSSTWALAFDKVFKNVTVRRNIQRTVAVPGQDPNQNNMYGSQPYAHQASDSETEEQE